MSLLASGEARVHEVSENSRGLNKCRIPLRQTPKRPRAPSASGKVTNNSDLSKGKFEVTNTYPRITKNATFLRSDENRPKSAGRVKEELGIGRMSHVATRSARPERERLLPAVKRPPITPKKLINDNLATLQKSGRPVIMVPMSQKHPTKGTHTLKNNTGLPDQETIKKCEELEMKQGVLSDPAQILIDLNEKESLTSRSDKVAQLKISWQDKIVQFEKMKNELKDKQKAIMELYAKMRVTHQKMSSLGQKANLPPADDLRIMNVAKMTPEQLLQLCAGARGTHDKGQHDSQLIAKCALSIDMNKLYNMPTKLVDVCEQTLLKRKEIIDWFESLRVQEKKISMQKLARNIDEFNAENEMLHCSLEKVKAEFLTELNEIVDFLRKGVNETIALQLRTEELTYELSELIAQNTDLRKQVHNADHLKTQTNKGRIEELEKELKEEKCKKMVIRDRLSRAEVQLKVGAERAAQLEATLEQARSQTWSLERTVQQLHDQNQKLQSDFDKELSKLTESIKENTAHLEEIADAREKLQAEKEDLEKRMTELSENYNESLKSMKHDINNNVSKLIEAEKKYEEEQKEKQKLESKVESLCAQLLESELRYKDLYKDMQEKEGHLSKMINIQKELEITKAELNESNIEIERYRDQLMKQGEAIQEIENNFKESVSLEEHLKFDLSNKEEYITELEKKQSLLEQQLQESESKMESYEEQLAQLKTHINQLQEDFGEFDNLSELHEMINQQRAKLLEATRNNGELAEALQKKDIELEHHMIRLTEQEHILEQRNSVIKMLSDKEEEQANIIKLLRNNLEMRAQADADLNQQIAEKNAEIDSLITNVETRKQQISQLEKIILTLEDQTRKASVQRRKDQDKISLLEKKIAEYESFHIDSKRSMQGPTENLDNLIKILEDELGAPFEPQLNTKEPELMMARKKYGSERSRRDKLENRNSSSYQTDHETVPTKIVMGNFVKKTYLTTNEDHFKGDNLDRKKAITNMDTQKWMHAPDHGVNIYDAPPSPKEKKKFPSFREIVAGGHLKDNYISRNLQLLMPNEYRDEKRCKMFKLVEHKL